MHDPAYKLLYSHRRMTADLLRGFLPDGPEAGFDFGTLEPLPASHVGRGLKRREGDLMWRLRAREALPVLLQRLKAAVAGPDLAELRRAFATWLRRSYEKGYGVFADAGEELRDELDRMEKAGEVVEMGSLALETWKERNREREARVSARAMERGMAQGMERGLTQGHEQGRAEGRTEGRAEGRAEGLEFERRLLESQASRRFGAAAGERLSALLAGVSEPERLAAVGDAIIDCGTGAELLAAAQQIVGKPN